MLLPKMGVTTKEISIDPAWEQKLKKKCQCSSLKPSWVRRIFKRVFRHFFVFKKLVTFGGTPIPPTPMNPTQVYLT